MLATGSDSETSKLFLMAECRGWFVVSRSLKERRCSVVSVLPDFSETTGSERNIVCFNLLLAYCLYFSDLKLVEMLITFTLVQQNCYYQATCDTVVCQNETHLVFWGDTSCWIQAEQSVTTLEIWSGTEGGQSDFTTRLHLSAPSPLTPPLHLLL